MLVWIYIQVIQVGAALIRKVKTLRKELLIPSDELVIEASE